MREFNICAAQGELYFTYTDDELPEGLTEVMPEDGLLLVGHSENGHHHVMEMERPCPGTGDKDDGFEPNVQMFRDKENPLLAWIKVNRPTVLRHQGDADTHEDLKFRKGVFRIDYQREHVPEGFRAVQD